MSNGGKRAWIGYDRETGRRTMMLLILLLVVLLLAVTPRWPYSRRWGYYPSGGLGVVLVVVIALVLMGNLRL
jgi:MFS superfamily sulfate permease-like transporter